MRHFLTILSLAAVLSMPGDGGLFTNPVTSHDWADPTVWRDGDRFYSLATGVGLRLRTSTDLVSWTGTAFSAQTVDDIREAGKVGRHFWAPDMVRIGDSWNLYVTLYNSLTDCGIGLFRSESPTGPFRWAGVITHSRDNGIKDSIDPEVVPDPSTGKVWLFFGSTGRMFRAELTADGSALAPGAEFTHVAGMDIDYNRSRTKVFEGAYLFRRGDWWYLFASAGFYSDHTYRIVVGRSSSLTGEFVDRDGRKMTDGYATDVISSKAGDAFYGPGHNGEIFTDSTGQDYILYHCHNKSVNGSAGSRFMMLQRLFWDDEGWPFVDSGSPAPLDIAPFFYPVK